MTGLAALLAQQPQTIFIGDEVYTLRPRLLADFAEKENYVLGLRPDPFAVVERYRTVVESSLHSTPETTTEPDRIADLKCRGAERRLVALEREAFRQATRSAFVTAEEMAEFDDSLHGIGWRLWRAVRSDHPEIDGVQRALDLIEFAGPERLPEIVRLLDRIDHRGPEKNESVGQPRAA